MLNLSKHKFWTDRTIRAGFAARPEPFLGHLQQPPQQTLEPQPLRMQAAPATPRRRPLLPMQPHPHVAQHQGPTDQEQPHYRVPCPGLGCALVPLSVARLDPEPAPLRRTHPGVRRRPQAPVGLDQCRTPHAATFPARWRPATPIATVARRPAALVRVSSPPPRRQQYGNTRRPLAPSGWSSWRPRQTTGIRKGERAASR